MQQLWAPWRMTYVGTNFAPTEECVLCKIGAKARDEISSDEIASNDMSNDQTQADEPPDYVVAVNQANFTVLNRFPYNSGHVMVVPTQHVGTISDLDGDACNALFAAVQDATRAIQSALKPNGFNIGINQGRNAGAGIEDHIHVHVVPRWSGDTNFMPVLADVKVLPEHMEATARRLSDAYASLPSSIAHK